MSATTAATPDVAKANQYQKQSAQLAQIRKDLLLNAAASGEWETATVKTISRTQELTKAIQQQKLTFNDYAKARKNGTMQSAIKEQQALQNAFATQMSSSAYGKSSMDLFIPKQFTSDLADARVALGMHAQALSASSVQLQSWGKNTQWAGRQLVVGFTVPLGMAALGLGKLAMEVDQNLTRIAKVYDTQSTNQVAQEKELSNLRQNSLATATVAAQKYGAAMSDILNVQAQLASTGLTGTNLQKTTQEVARISFLGDLDYQKAIDMTIALQTAFGLSVDQLSEKFNFMNQVENSTSLTIQDIAEATPRAASALSSLGVSVEEMTILLTSMKESGVDAAEGANALKSATTKLLNPTKAAREMFAGFNINIESIVKKNGGNLFKILEDLSKAMADIDPLTKQKAIAELFGTYQFNRLNASLTNLGDALSGTGDTANQTSKAIEAAGMGASKWANTAASEVSKMQQSVSGKFKIAVESLKASLVPLGQTVLQALTPVIEVVSGLVNWFNSWSDTSKTVTLAVLGLVAVAGPIVMLIGLVGNLIGSFGKGIGAIGKLITRFAPMTAEQKAQQLMALRTSNIWDEQASSAAILSQSIDSLTKSMERNAAAQGLMVTKDGRIGNRTIVENAAGNLQYGAGSLDNAGNKIGGNGVKKTSQDAALYAQMKKDTANMAENTEKMRTNWGSIIGGVGSLALGAVAVKDMAGGSNDLLSNLTNAAMIAASFSGLGLSFKSIGGILTKALSPLNNLFTGTRIAAAGSKVASGLAAPFAKVAASLGERGGVLGGIGKMGGAIGRVIPLALRLFGPIGIIAGAVGIIATVSSKMSELEDRQKAVNESAKQWADILGYAYQQGTLTSDKDNPKNDYAARIDDVKALRDANGDLVKKLEEAKKAGGDFGQVYKVAMAEALKVVSSGGSADQARQAMGIALQASGIKDEQVIDRLMVRFDQVDLSNPDEIRNQLMQQIESVYNSIPSGKMNAGFLRSIFGGDISGAARTAGTQAGQQFADALLAASDPKQKSDLIMKMQGVLNKQMTPDFSNLKKNYGDAFSKLGINSMQQLSYAMKNRKSEVVKVLMQTYGEGGEQALQSLENTQDKYQEMLDVFFQSFGTQYGMTQDEIDRMKKNFSGAGALIKELGVDTSKSTKVGSSLGNVWGHIEDMVRGATGAVAGFNRESAQASADQVANALQSSYSNTSQDIFGEADRLLNEKYSNSIDAIQARGKARQDALDAEADRAQKSFDARQKATEKSFDMQQKEMDARFDAQQKSMENSFKAREKSLDSYWKASDKSFESRWKNTLKAEDAAYENRIARAEAEAKTVNDSYESRIDAIQKTIDAESAAEDTRQKIFEAEQRRIERMASRFNTSIDFNTALNSGSIDEAARIMNNAGAQEASWSIDDQKRKEEEARQSRVEAYEAEAEALKVQQQARADAYENYIDQLRKEKEARMDTLREIQDAEKDARDEEKQRQQEALADERELQTERLNAAKQAESERLAIARETESERLAAAREAETGRINAAKQADTETTASKVAAEQAKQDAARRALDMELRTLREFVPTNEQELRDHVARIQDVYARYGLNLQGQGNAWSQFIGNSLSANVNAASARISNDIAWDQIGQQLTARMANGTGVSISDLRFFLQNGRFPKQGIGGFNLIDSLLGFKHTGGVVKHSGGELGFTQADRVGVQRSAQMMPSEVPAILKRGEFVVNEKSTRKHRNLLEQINGGGVPSSAMISRHDGGGVGEATQMIPGVMGMAIGQAMQAAVANWLLTEMMKERSGDNGGYAGGSSTWQALDQIRKNLFPGSVLTSSVRAGDPGFHGRGQAIDIGVPGNKPSLLVPIAQRIAQLYPGSTELINNPGGSIKNGVKVPASFWGAKTWAEHANHVHWAMNPTAMAALGGMGSIASAPLAVGGNQAIVKNLAASMYGWTGAQWDALYKLVMGESGFRNTAQNPSSTAYGMFQFLNSTWAGVGAKKTSDPTLQTQAGLKYIKQSYGTPMNAYNKWSSRNPHWYDDGGMLPTGLSMVMNGTGKPEPVFTSGQWDTLTGLLSMQNVKAYGTVQSANSATNALVDQATYKITVDLRGAVVRDEVDIEGAIIKTMNKIESDRGRSRKVGS